MGHAVFADQPYRPLPATPKPTVHGTQSAIVVGPKGKRSTPTSSRAALPPACSVHWDREGGTTRTAHADAVSQGWAGAGMG